MNYNGPLLKMQTNLQNPVEYELPIGDELIYMNSLIGKYIIFKWVRIHLGFERNPDTNIQVVIIFELSSTNRNILSSKQFNLFCFR